MEQENPIFKFLNENKLTDLDEKSFLDKYSNPEKAKEIHSFMAQNKLTNLDENQFFDKYLKKKEPASSAVPNLLKPLPQSGEQPKAGFPTSPSEAMKVSTQLESTNQGQPKPPKGMFEIKKLPSEKPEFVERLAKNAEIQEKLLNDPTYALLSGSEDKITKINIEKNKAVAAERGQTMKEFKSDQDEYLAMFLDDRQKQEFSGIRGRLDLLNEIKKAKANGESTQELEKIYDKQVKEYSQAKASQVYEADKRIRELNIGLDEASPEDRPQILEEIKLLEASKKPFFINTKKAAADIVQQEGLEGDASDQEKVRDYSHALLRERSDLRESLGIKGAMTYADKLRLSTISAGNPLAERLQKVEQKLKAISPIVLLNESAITEKEGALDVFGKSLVSSINPLFKTSMPTNQSLAMDIKEGLGLSGVSNEAVAKNAMSTIEKTSKPYEAWSANDLAQMSGTTLGFLPKFFVAAAVTEGVGGLAAISPYWRAISLLAEEGTLGAEAASPILTAIQSTKVGRGLLKAAFSGVETGVQSEVESRIFSADKDEVTFLTGFSGGVLGKGLGIGLDVIGKGLSKSITSVFGNKAPDATNKLINLAKVAYTKTKEVNTKALGEVGEETGEQLAQLWQESDNGAEFFDKVSEEFGDPSKALRFFLSTYMMGFGFSSGTYVGKWSAKEAAAKYADLPPRDKAIADNIISELKQEQNGAETEAAISTIRESKLPEDKKAKLEEEAKQQGEAINKVIEGDADTTSLKPFEVAETKVEPQAPSEKISAATTSNGIYVKDGEQGVIKTEGQSVVFETNDKIIELGNKDEIGEKPLSEFGIEKEEPLNIEIGEDNSVVIDGNRFVNNYSDPAAAINMDADGNVVSVNLETEDGKKRTFRGQRAQEIAYQYKLKEFEQNATEESIARLEQEVTSLEGKNEQAKSKTKERSTAKGSQQQVKPAAKPAEGYKGSLSSKDYDQGYGGETVEAVTGGDYYKNVIAAAKAEGISADQVIKDLARSRALDGLETREDLEAIDRQIKQDLATEAKAAAAPEVEPIDEFVDANYQQIMADLKLKNRLTTSGCAY